MNDRFEHKQLSKKVKKDKESKKSKGEDGPSKKNEMKSSKFFSKLQEVAKDDKARKDQKRQAKIDGNAVGQAHNN